MLTRAARRRVASVAIFVVTSKALFQTDIVGIMKIIMRANSDDAALVADSLGGDREAFGYIVTRWFFRLSKTLSSQVAWLNLLWVFPAMTWCRFLMRRHRVT